MLGIWPTNGGILLVVVLRLVHATLFVSMEGMMPSIVVDWKDIELSTWEQFISSENWNSIFIVSGSPPLFVDNIRESCPGENLVIAGDGLIHFSIGTNAL